VSLFDSFVLTILYAMVIRGVPDIDRSSVSTEIR